MELSWTPVTDLDISWYEVRFQNVTSGATWNESTPIAKVVRRKSNAVTLNAQVGSYCIKAVDKLGNVLQKLVLYQLIFQDYKIYKMF